MGAGDVIREFARKVDRDKGAILLVAGLTCLEEIKVGGPITGAPGQPVDVGDLLRSWDMEPDNPTNPTRIEITSNSDHAVPIETGIGSHGPMTLRSAVGGFGSVAAVASRFPNVLQHAVDVVVGRG